MNHLRLSIAVVALLVLAPFHNKHAQVRHPDSRSDSLAESFHEVDSDNIDVCGRLSDLTCTRGVLTDNTGNSWSGTTEELEQRESQRMNEIATPFFESKMKKDPQGFRASLSEYLSKSDLNDRDDAAVVKLAVEYGLRAAQRKMPAIEPMLGRLFEGKKIMETDLVKKVFGKTAAEEKMFSDFFVFLRRGLVDPELDGQVKRDFEKVRKRLLQVIADRFATNPDRDTWSKTVGDVKFGGVDCEDLGSILSVSNRIESLLVPNAFYDPTTGYFKYCNGLGRYNQSLFNRYAVIAHELTHSIDPCQDERGHRECSAPDLVRCLRDARSVGAKKKTPWSRPLGDLLATEPLTDCAGGDQIGESFADFLSAETLYLLVKDMRLDARSFRKGFANTMRFPRGCDSKRYFFDEHPELRPRIDNLLAAHPGIRRLMGCSVPPAESVRYCGDQP